MTISPNDVKDYKCSFLRNYAVVDGKQISRLFEQQTIVLFKCYQGKRFTETHKVWNKWQHGEKLFGRKNENHFKQKTKNSIRRKIHHKFRKF